MSVCVSFVRREWQFQCYLIGIVIILSLSLSLSLSLFLKLNLCPCNWLSFYCTPLNPPKGTSKPKPKRKLRPKANKNSNLFHCNSNGKAAFNRWPIYYWQRFCCAAHFFWPISLSLFYLFRCCSRLKERDLSLELDR